MHRIAFAYGNPSSTPLIKGGDRREKVLLMVPGTANYYSYKAATKKLLLPHKLSSLVDGYKT